MKRLLFLAPIALFAGLAWMFYAGLSGPPPSELPSPLLNRSAPDFAMPALDARAQGFTRRNIASGHPVVINFWASWCAPCRVEHPMLAMLAQNGAALYGVAYKDEPVKARAFLDELGNPFARIAADKDGRAGIEWGVTGVPETFVIDGKGVVRAHYAGPLTPDVIATTILPALAAAPKS